MTAEMLYKLLNDDGVPAHGGQGTWSLPANGEPGAWREVEGPIVPCENGLHLVRFEHLLDWLAPTLYEAEYAGEMLEHENKIVVRRARLTRRVATWNDRTLRLFAADCAEHVLPLFERDYPNDARPRRAIEAARRYAHGECDAEELATARTAAHATRRSLARPATYAAYAAAGSAAWASGGDAAGSAARDAARAAGIAAGAAGAAERQWQLDRLRHYLNGEQVS